MRDVPNPDSQALLLLCSAVGLADSSTPNAPAPLTLSEWNQLEHRVRSSPLQRPEALLGCDSAGLARALELAADEAERLAALLGRASPVALELENLADRGIWAVTRLDENYPARLRETLQHQAPTVLFGAGQVELLQRAGVAVVGSRQIDDAGIAFAREVGRKCAEAGAPVVSGGARGTDSLAMEAALETGGVVFGVLADSLERTIRPPEMRQLLLDRRLVLLTPYAPAAGFSVGAAMGRNKVIYGLAEAAVVVSSDVQKGGTWAGAVETLKAGWCPVFVRGGAGVPAGNSELEKKGAQPLTASTLGEVGDLPDWLRRHATRSAATSPEQTDLFGLVAEPSPAAPKRVPRSRTRGPKGQ